LKVTKKAIIAKEWDNAKLISEAYSVIDKAAKKNLLHKKSAARKKASIMKMTKAQ
jgi:ribosomal protein S20